MAKYRVAAVKCDDYSRLHEAFEELAQNDALSSFAAKVRGKKVLVKPNILGLFPPEKAVCTHPEMVRAVVRWLRAAGALVTVGDNCGLGGYGLNQSAAQKSGIADASEGAFVNIAKDGMEKEVESRFF